ncbi:mRNA splicing protein [Coemansia sp. RSA 922]|nr:mRNA splicing protein [Coemansia sp. S680]KAJ2033855.1 mRNA splicing protein [Coemansia sp. S3946]KAJ2065535.1 mRNA splicing protein [Coemansia sp. S155-1]KAJ2096886.1 mRNA splicing protein [Coemansia sp. S142-1]KAJ2113317.1 mRNA splicing protein [Coemansia sp. RSA 922]KAJ2340016.1 mRNA splicing protein [Coemansia sp. RSA 2673]
MSSISQFLPEPKHTISRPETKVEEVSDVQALVATTTDSGAIPEYGQRLGWVPKTAGDFGDGGAYPEIHVLQYPLGMGKKRAAKGNALSKQVDSDGNTSYSALANFGRRENETVHSQFKDLVPLRQRKDFDEEDAIPLRPDGEAVREAAERTKLALDKITNSRANDGKKVALNGIGRSEPTFVRYTPGAQPGAASNSGAAQRIVRVSEMPLDPMEPPKVKHQKKARAPGSPPAPVMHSPPRKLTAEEQKEWIIPPCVSNWKNIHGFTVSLDKRLATDGRGMEDLSVSDGFARLSEALVSAESNARREIQERANIQQTLARREKDAKEERLRMLAQKAREERAAAAPHPRPDADSYVAPPLATEEPREEARPVRRDPNRRAAADFFTETDSKRGRSESPPPSPRDGGERERDEVRRERRKQHEREMRAGRMGAEGKAKYSRAGESRDISEKIALGLAKPTAARESLYDSRLFNQPSASNAALQNEEAYNLYDKPLFAQRAQGGNYRPKAEEGGDVQEVERLMGSDRFGAELRAPSSSQKKDSGPRSGPVEFEKGDVFGIDAFVGGARRQDKDK